MAGQYVPYIMPQEHGLKCDTTWIQLAGKRRSLKITGAAPFAFSASHFRPLDITRAFHTPDLKPRPETVLCIDAAHRGVGTGSCGPDTFEPYRIQGTCFTLDLCWRFG